MKRLGFGAMRLPLKDANDKTSIDQDMLNQMVDIFMEAGFTYFDTAYLYHDEMSEPALKKALVDRYPRESFVLADKMPTVIVKSADDYERYFANLIYGFRPGIIRENKTLYITLLAYAVFGIAINIFMPYLILYYTVSLGMDNYVLLFAPAIILAAAFTFFYGKVYDRKGFRVSVLPPLALLMAGFLVLYFFKNTPLVFAGTLIMLCGYLSGMAVFGAMLRDRTPEKKAGMFQGQRIIGQVLIPGVIGPAIGAWVLRNADTIVNDDGTTSFIPNENIFLAAFVAAVCIFAVLLPLFGLIKKEKDNA